MRHVLPGSWHSAMVLAFALLATTLAHAGTFTVSSESEYQEVQSALQAAQFLARATFGYTVTDVGELAEEIRTVGHRRALSNWIDDQIFVTPTLHEPLVLQLLQNDGYSTPYADRPSGAANRLNYRGYAWWQIVLEAPDQLRQRAAFALMQIVVINDDANIFNSNAPDSSRSAQGVNQPRYTGTVHYQDMLLQHALGNYRTVLGNITLHPVMGVFLTHINNRKPSADGLVLPDENYAREILQLFSMGEYRTDMRGVLVKDRAGGLIQNYTNDDIKALARVFTGLRYAPGDGSTSVNLHDPMEIRVVNDHDFDEKVLPNLHLTVPPREPSVTNAHLDLNQAIDHIFSHPNVGPHIARLLIQRFVKANPSKRYVFDVASAFNNNGQGDRGDLLAVIRAILLHREALRSQHYSRIRDSNGAVLGLKVHTRGTEFSKLVEPILRYTQFIKVFDGQAVDAQKGIRLRPSLLDLNQLPYQAPSVFNYFRPDHEPPGFQDYTTSRRLPNGVLHSPEAQIYTPVFANRFQNLMYRHLHNNVSSYNSLDFSSSFSAEEALAQVGLARGDFSALLERLDAVMCHGSLRDESKLTISNALVASGNTNTSELARLAIFGVLGTPECAIDE